jgi:hypothetical protein
MRKSVIVLAGLALAGAGLPFLAQTASAQEPGPEGAKATAMVPYCPDAYLCVWKDANYQGPRYDFKYNNPNWGNTRNWQIENEDSSWWNAGLSGSYSSVFVYRDAGYVGYSFCLDRGHGRASDGSMNDRGNGNKWVNSC